MKKYVKAIINLIVALAVLLFVVLLLPKLLVFFTPFIIGWVIASIASPLVHFFEKKIKLKRKTSSAFVIIVVIALVVLVFYLAGAKFGNEMISLINALPDMWKSAEADFIEVGSKLSIIYSRLPLDVQESISGIINQIGSYMGSLLSKISTPTINAVGNFAKQVPSVIIGIVMALLSSYFFVAERGSVNTWFEEHTPLVVQNRYFMIKRSMVKAIGGYLKAQLKIEVCMYLFLVVSLTILKVNYALLIALGIALLDILPFFGTGTVMIPWAIIKILSSDYKMAIGLLIVWGVGQLARQVIQPKFVGDSIGVPPLPTLFLLYIGYRIGGVLGMIVAVPIGLIVYTMYEEGVFDTIKNSIFILLEGLNRFRKLEQEDLKEVKERKEQNKVLLKELKEKRRGK